MALPRDVDPTRRHASVTAGLAAIAALVLVALEDPAQRKTAVPAGVAAGTGAAADRPRPATRHAGYRQFNSSARLLIRPAVAGKTTSVLQHNK